MKRLYVTLVAAVLTVACSNSAPQQTASASQLRAEGKRKPAPDFILTDASGARVKLSDYKGKVVLLNFWATWCGPCKAEIPWFMEFERSYRDKDFAVLGVSMDEEGWRAVKPYVEKNKMNYRVVVGDKSVKQAFGKILTTPIESIPATFLIDRQGRVAGFHDGIAEKSTYASEIAELLGARSQS